MALASVWCLQSHVFDALVASPFYNKEAQKLTKFKRMRVPCCGINQHNHQKQSAAIQDPFGISKRQCLLQTVIAAISLPPFVSVALAAGDNVPEDFRLYSDELNKFKLMIPQDWQVGTGENNGVKSLTGFFPAEPSGSNITVVISGLGADFTRLESFGKVDAFAENLVSGLDRSWQRPPGVAAKLIDSKAANGLYYIEYTLQNPGESRRHLYSVLGIANNGWYNRLYTVTGQFLDEESAKYGSQIEKAVASFRLTRENNAGLGVNF